VERLTGAIGVAEFLARDGRAELTDGDRT
jgi:hypothetical protein